MKFTVENQAAKYKTVYKMKAIATSALVLMALIFVISTIWQEIHPILSFIKAFAEAAMIGALADWFAVTALFRQPLGLPIPHTAIIPKNKDKIGEGLGEFIESNFLNKDVIEQRIQGFEFSREVSNILTNEKERQVLISNIVDIIPYILEIINDSEFKRFTKNNTEKIFNTINFGNISANFIDLLTSRGKHNELLNELFNWLRTFLNDDTTLTHIRQNVRSRVLDKVWGWVNSLFSIDTKVSNAIIDSLNSTLLQIINQPNHYLREKLNSIINNLAQKLRNQEYKNHEETIKQWLINSPELDEYFSELLSEIKQRIADDLRSEHSVIRQYLNDAFSSIGEQLQDKDNEELTQKIDAGMTRAVVSFVDKYDDKVSEFIASEFRKWDTHKVTEQLELQVGADLQYIRLNGTVIGGLIGLAIYSISLFLK